MTSLTVPESVLTLVIGCLYDRYSPDGSVSEQTYDQVIRSLVYFPLFEDSGLRSTETRQKILSIVNSEDSMDLRDQIAQDLPAPEDSLLREFAFVLGVHFSCSPLGPAEMNTGFLCAQLNLKSGCKLLVEAVPGRHC